MGRRALGRSGVLVLLGLLPTAAAAQDGAGGGSGAADSVVYVVSPASRFAVKTGKAGLLGFAGHDHLVRARAFWGRIVHYRDSSAASHVTIAVSADSLDVISSSDTAERRQVTEAMHRDVLHTDRYHEITFASHAVTPSDGGFRVQGELTLAGVTRDLMVDLAVVISGDTLRATTRFTIKQTDFGIRPYRGGPGGLVRVADGVTFDIEAIGVAQPGPLEKTKPGADSSPGWRSGEVAVTLRPRPTFSPRSLRTERAGGFSTPCSPRC